jgi:hypothetical protein
MQNITTRILSQKIYAIKKEVIPVTGREGP